MSTKYSIYTLWTKGRAMPTVTLDDTITIAISVRDRHISAKWYSEKLGFELLHHIDEAGWSELRTRTDGVTLGLGEQTEPTPGNTVPVFGVMDIAKARKDLEATGVKFDGDTIVVEGMVSTATFYDPDGNALMLAQDLTDKA
jgi:predicted enzyme related to lactoylglutathione lyase